MIVVAKNISVLQLFINRMPKMCAILQLVSAPLNPIPIAEHFRRSHPQCEHSYGQHNVREDLLRTLNKHFTYKVKLMMSSYLGLFVFIFFVQINSKINKKSRSGVLTI